MGTQALRGVVQPALDVWGALVIVSPYGFSCR